MTMLVADVLAQIMQLAAPSDLQQKSDLARVCSLWRREALEHHPLWASFSAWTDQDYKALPLVLSRTGCVKLDIELGCKSGAVVPQYVATVGTFPRLRRLALHSWTSTTLPDFFGYGLRLPVLESLEFEGYKYIANVESPDLHLVPPSPSNTRVQCVLDGCLLARPPAFYAGARDR